VRIAFYAPMKPPDHPVPSGDRQMARLLMAALERAGHEVSLAARLRAWAPSGDPRRQARLAALGEKLAERFLRRAAPRPELWFTYHLYYKAPDWIGPRVAAALDIPYVVAEASVAPKRAGGPWDSSHRAVLAALDQAAAVLPLNPHNLACLPDKDKVREIAPFIDAASFLAARYDPARLPSGEGPWIVTAAMMRPGAKLASYRLLAEALSRLLDLPWRLLVIGDGPARPEVEAAFAALPSQRLRWLGELAPEALPTWLAAGDVFAWPAIDEAYGMALLEAQAAGLPVVAGETGGIAAVVARDDSGLLVPAGDPAAFAEALRALLDAPERRRRMSAAARRKIAQAHDLPAAARRLSAILDEVTAAAPGGAPR
jgi:glycosyltransferase involved in cell wall biosynthesis